MVCSAALSPLRSACTVPNRSTSATVTKGSLSAWHLASAAPTALADAPTVIRFCDTTLSCEGWTSAAGTAAGAAACAGEALPALVAAVAPAVRASAPAAAAAKTLLDFFTVVLLFVAGRLLQDDSVLFHRAGNGYCSTSGIRRHPAPPEG